MDCWECSHLNCCNAENYPCKDCIMLDGHNNHFVGFDSNETETVLLDSHGPDTMEKKIFDAVKVFDMFLWRDNTYRKMSDITAIDIRTRKLLEFSDKHVVSI